MTSVIPIPDAVHKFFAKFPLHTYPPIQTAAAQRAAAQLATGPRATLWIAPPTPDIVIPSTNTLSADVECLKWQAYIALRLRAGTNGGPAGSAVGVRWDVAPEGGVDGCLPCLHVLAPPAGTKAAGEVLGARMIPGWVDGVLGRDGDDAFEGYRDDAARDESRAWVALLEGTVHAALTLATPAPLTLKSLLLYAPTTPGVPSAGAAPSSSAAVGPASLATHLSPPPAPATGLASLFPPHGERVSPLAVQAQYHDAIVALADGLGADAWFLCSSGPTALDALVFAYLHCLLAGPDSVRLDVARRTNLVTWERHVRVIVQTAFVAV